MNSLEHGRECYQRRAWGDAYDALLHADQATPLEADDLDRLATAAYLSGRDAEFQRILERLYHRPCRVAATARARRAVRSGSRSRSRCAERLGRSNAWTARGQRLVEDRDVRRARLRGRCRRRAAAARRTRRCRARDRGPGRRDRRGLSRRGPHGGGAATCKAARSSSRAMSSPVSSASTRRCSPSSPASCLPIMTALMYCSVIDTCRQVYALGRAREWTAAFSSVCEQQPEMVAFTGVCLVHRAEIMQLQGAWPDALTEACRACERARARRPQAAGRRALSTGRDSSAARRVCEGGGRLSRRQRAGVRAATRTRAAATGAGTHRRRVRGDPPADERDQRSAAARQAPAGAPRDHARARRCRGGPARAR